MTTFASPITGGHFNTSVTLVHMFRSGPAALESKLLGIIYIFG